MILQERILDSLNPADSSMVFITDFYKEESIWGIKNIYKKERENQPRICMTAGSHAEEYSGINALIDIIPIIERTFFNYLIVPARDPIGYGGFQELYNISLKLKPIYIVNFHNSYKVFIYKYIDIYIIYSSPNMFVGMTMYIKIIKKILYYGYKIDANTPIYIPINKLTKQNGSPFVFAHVIYLDDYGAFQHLNTNFFNTRLRSICTLRKYIFNFSPDYIIDCHEGWGKYIYIYSTPRALYFTSELISILLRMGLPLRFDDECAYPGIIIKNKGSSLQNYFDTKLNCVAVTIEIGEKFSESEKKRLYNLILGLVINQIFEESVY